MASEFFPTLEDELAARIQGAFRQHQARFKLKEQAAWKINENLEYSSEQTEAKLREMFEALLNASKSLSPAIQEALEKLQSPIDEEELLRSTNPNNTYVGSDYQGPHVDGPITRQVFVDLIGNFQRGQTLHLSYVYQILHQALRVLQTLPNCNCVDLTNLGHVTVVGDLHGQLADLLHIFHKNGLPSADNAYVFNGDFVDRGQNSTEVILLLLVALILYPTSVFLNRGNHEDIQVNINYGFQEEVTRKYGSNSSQLLELFTHTFSWLPLYSIINTGIHRIIVMHGGISDRIHLSKVESLPRNQYWSLIIKPKSRTSNDQLTAAELDEYEQIQDLLWSDPDPNPSPPRGKPPLGCRKNDQRKIACYFGGGTTQRFLDKYNLSMIIRSHQVKPQGYEYRHGGKVLTIFSASNYDQYNQGAVVRWELNHTEPQIISHNVQSDEMEHLSFSRQVKQTESSTYRQLIEKIYENESPLLEAFQRADRERNGHVSLRAWESIMSGVLQMNIPWLTIRSKIVQEDSQGVLYGTMFQGYTLTNSKVQMPNSELMQNLYQWKDILLAIFKLIDTNHSGSINREEFTQVIRFLMQHEHIDNSDLDNYVDDLTDTMDSDGNGRIDFEEFFNGFQLVCAS